MAKVLVVDDDKNLRLLYEQELSEEGHEVTLAGSGPEALDYLKNQRPDLIILDILMPHMDGYQFCEAIRAVPPLQNIPVIVITGRPVAEVDERLKKMGISAILQKPFTTEAIMEQVNKLLYHIPPTPKKVPLNEIQ